MRGLQYNISTSARYDFRLLLLSEAVVNLTRYLAEAVVDLNITVPNDAITIPTTIPKMPFPFAKELPPAVDGGSTSDDNPPQRLNVSSTACHGKSNLFGIWEEGSQRRMRQATVALWIAMTVGLGIGFIGL